jgi:S-methylmethionine-dependent homocysteine/selenocysteine methylase
VSAARGGAGGAGSVTLLDGALGTELERRGLPLPPPLWSARAVAERPELLTAIHRDYAAAGADVHTAATFRTTERALAGTPWAARWRELAARAVALAREAAGPGARVAGSIAPLEDCFSPELTPDAASLQREHAALARCLADAGCDVLLVETMPTTRELLAATRAAAATGLPVWSAVTLGPRGDFFDERALREAREVAAGEGAAAFLINCTPPDRITALLRTLGPHGGLELGAYGNDLFDGHVGWPPERYAEQALFWREAGATIVGGCCGTGPEHLRVVARALGHGRPRGG